MTISGCFIKGRVLPSVSSEGVTLYVCFVTFVWPAASVISWCTFCLLLTCPVVISPVVWLPLPGLFSATVAFLFSSVCGGVGSSPEVPPPLSRMHTLPSARGVLARAWPE